MTNKYIKQTLIISFVMIVLSIAMLAGTTLAWFTDSVNSKNNTINTGNLSVKVSYKTDLYGVWTELDNTSDIFSGIMSPGATKKVYLKIENAGNLAVKYSIDILKLSNVTSTNLSGAEIDLTDSIVAGAKFCDNENQLESLTIGDDEFKSLDSSVVNLLDSESSYNLILKATGEVDYNYGLIELRMNSTSENATNYSAGAQQVPELKLGLSFVAKQAPYEADAFSGGDFYDTEAGLSD